MTQVHRDENGRFTHGNPGGPGRPPKAQEERLHVALVDALDNGAWDRIVKKAVEQAEQGDALARKFLASYALGTPVHRSAEAGGSTPDDWLRAMRDDTPEQQGG